ncbi:hypothetical protein Naga_101054g2 [Nannochloropsis gaditana]|uniref:Uncharacterized protein n=1 Tax=Nannochloropsis gaditana TaxID=72520 RepID=W7TH88_9STRA|nr:hypothetical protein Naga_101054g2 [Nannochloropsis gaditana]
MIERTLDRIKLHKGGQHRRKTMSFPRSRYPSIHRTDHAYRQTWHIHPTCRRARHQEKRCSRAGKRGKNQDQQGAGGLLLLTCVRIKRRSSSRLALCSFWASTDHAVDPKAFRCGNMSPSRCHDWRLGGRLPLGKEGGEARKRRGEV